MTDSVGERRNKFPNPRFVSTGTLAANSGDCTLTYQGGGVLTMSPLAGASLGGWCDFVVPVTPGAYVASVYYRFADGANDFRGRMLSVRVTDATDAVDGALVAELDDSYSVGRRVLRFTVPDGVSYVRMRFRGSKSRDVEFCAPQVELASTYDAAVNGGYPTRSSSTGARSRSKRRGVVA